MSADPCPGTAARTARSSGYSVKNPSTHVVLTFLPLDVHGDDHAYFDSTWIANLSSTEITTTANGVPSSSLTLGRWLANGLPPSSEFL